MPDEIISKNVDKLQKVPNLADYYATYQNFNWEDCKNSELLFFADGKFNAAYNAIDKHLKSEIKNKNALIWESTDGKNVSYTYLQIAQLSNQFANYIKKLGVVKGDRVFIFLPRVPYLYIAFLGILKIGAIAGTLFSAFQEQALFDRLENSGAKVLITNKELVMRVVNIRSKLPKLENIVIVDDDGFDSQLMSLKSDFEIAHLDPNDYAFILYTSGTTGKPKGVVHRHLAILSEHITAKFVLDIQSDDIYWCTADPGWVTGIAYGILSAFSNGVTSIVYEGRFSADKWYEIIQKYKVSVWYTAPTAIRMLMGMGEQLPKKFDFSSLRHILSVGEPLNPEAIRWGLKFFQLPFHDNWWQTETGCICIANYPSLDIKVGSMGKPFPGIVASIVDDSGNEVADHTEGNIALKPGWPSMMQTIWQNEEKYKSYFKNNWYFSGDRGWKDKDGYFWFVGRADDVIKTSGERIGPFEVESALVEHPAVVEAGVIGKKDALRGEIVKAFVVLKKDYQDKIINKTVEDNLKQELSQFVKIHLAGHAYPREVEFIDKLPKTRSGKIMRRILKAKEAGLPVGDTSTLEEY